MDDVQNDKSLSAKLRELAEQMPRPYEEDRSYSQREKDELLANIATVTKAAEVLERIERDIDRERQQLLSGNAEFYSSPTPSQEEERRCPKCGRSW